MSIKGARCLVLGGGGFIGTNLCRRLLSLGADVEVYGRPPRPDGISRLIRRWHEYAFEDRKRIAAAIRGKEIIFHLLGGSAPIESNADPARDLSLSVLPTLQLLDVCREVGIKRLLFASSGGTVYGPAGSSPITEAAATEPITAYGINKLAIEKYLGLYRHLWSLDSVVLRISNAYGPFQRSRQGQGLLGAMLEKAVAGETIDIWGDGSIVRDFIYVGDVVEAMIAAAGYSGEARVFNVGSGIGRSVRSVADAVIAATGIDPARVRHLPGRSADVPVNVLDATLIRQEMGWLPRTGWREGLMATLSWIRRGTEA